LQNTKNKSFDLIPLDIAKEKSAIVTMPSVNCCNSIGLLNGAVQFQSLAFLPTSVEDQLLTFSH